MVYYPKDSFTVKEIDNSSNKNEEFFSNRSRVSPEKISRRSKINRKISLKKAFLVVFLLFLVSGGVVFYKTNATFDKMTGEKNSLIKSIVKMIPLSGNFFQILPVEGEEKSPIERVKDGDLERLNILLLGLRGVGDPNGGLLTDTMMIMSLDVESNDIALISIPRDLYVKMPNSDYKGKINEAYAQGYLEDGWKEGLSYSKETIENVTGLEIHYATSVDFEAFKEIIDVIDGVDIYLEKPFSEKYQFEEGAIDLPQGYNTIDGSTALLYVRARFSTNDFDRARRQQQVLVGVKDKALSLGILSNPVKVMSIFNALGEHVRTDSEFWEMKDIVLLMSKADLGSANRLVLSTAEDGLLYQTYTDAGSYILLPEGDNFDLIQEACAQIFD